MDIRIAPQSWLWRPRTKPIKLIEIHATRGNTTPEKQMSASLNWVQSANNNQGGWGSSFSYVIGTDGSQGTVLDDDQMPTYSAGYGGSGSTYAIDEYGLSYELAQSSSQEPFTDACYLRAAREIAIKCKRYGIPPVFIEVPLQSGPIPTGLVRHDRCQNGYVLGKTDPGNQFDEGKFIALLQAELQEDDMWSGWENMGGWADGGPAIASWASGRLDLFAVGGGGKLYHRWFPQNGRWSGWEDLGAPPGVQLTGTPAAVSWSEGRIDVFVPSSDGTTWHLWFSLD